MAVLLKQTPNILENSCILRLTKRFRGKINIQRPREPHFERAKVIALTQPFFPSTKYNKSTTELCANFKPKRQQDEGINKYQQILAKECLNWFNHSKAVFLFHLNPMSADERFNAYITFKKQNMHLHIYGKKTLQMALEGTKYEAFTQNYVSQNILLFNPEPTIKPILKANKKFPQMILLSGIYEGSFLSKDALVELSKIPDLKTAQAQLVGVLQSVGGGLVRNLTSCQNTLVHQLQERAKQLEES